MYQIWTKIRRISTKMIILIIIETISTDIEPFLTKIEWKTTQIQRILTKISQNLIQF